MSYRALQIAFVYVGTIVGAGFATGKEIVQFFTQYGSLAVVLIAMSGALFIFFGNRMMVMALRLEAKSYEQLMTYVFGKRAGALVNVVMFVMLLAVTTVMLSGAGALFAEQWGVPASLGLFVTLLLSFFTMLFGLSGILSVNMIVVPMMIMFSIFIATTNGGAGTPFSFRWQAFVSPFSYAAFNLMMAQVVLVPLAAEVKDEATIRLGGWIGGVVLSLILLSSHAALATLPDVLAYSVPMAEVVRRSLTSFSFFYVVVIYGEIFTSFIAGVFGLHRKLALFFPFRPSYTLIGLLAIMYVFSLFGYDALLSVLYPLLGYVSLAFIALLFHRQIPR